MPIPSREMKSVHGRVAGKRNGSVAKITAAEGWDEADFDAVVTDLQMTDVPCKFDYRTDASGVEVWHITMPSHDAGASDARP